jgi:hypothetical protein
VECVEMLAAALERLVLAGFPKSRLVGLTGRSVWSEGKCPETRCRFKRSLQHHLV